jgi:hypothetical protein
MYTIDANTGELICILTYKSSEGITIPTYIPIDTYLSFSGKMHYVEHLFNTVSTGAIIKMFYVVGDTRLHVLSQITATGEALLETFEETNVSNFGVPIPVINMDRTQPCLLKTAVYRNPSVIDVGTKLRSALIPNMIGNLREGVDWILKPNTNYMIRVKNISSDSIKIHVSNSMFEI